MQELHLNQRQVCGMTGKSKGSVSQYLSGKQIPSEDVLMLSRLVDTFFSRTSWTMLPYVENHSISVA
ncbi:helix-turn-helix domain-containing protein [Fusicatenibacter sp.]